MLEYEIVIVGSGFSGLAAAHELLRSGFDDLVILERAGEVGGTWRDNSYPGCACDVPSHLYSFSFAPNPDWSRAFSPQPEIQSYLRRVAAEHGLAERIRFNSELLEARWDEGRGRWALRTSRGEISARHLVLAAGPLSEPALPAIPGLDRFQGRIFHSARWDHDYDLSGRRVAVVGTGASAIQFVPEIQPLVSKLHLFQRTAPWVLGRRDRRLAPLERRLYRRFPILQRLVRAGIFWGRELLAIPLLKAGLSPLTARLAMAHLERQVPDPELRRRLTPDYAPGCKRILLSNRYYPALSRPNVEVVTSAVAELRENSVVDSEGVERPVDAVIFGTGFHVTDLPIASRIHGRGGRSLEAAGEGSPQAHRGTCVAGFPNLFLMLGPNTGLGHTSVVLMAEAQARYIRRALRAAAGAGAIEVRAQAQAAWNRWLQRALRGTVWTAGGCRSWYLDRNGLNTTLWPGFSFQFRAALRRFDAENYLGLAGSAPAPLAGRRVLLTGAAGGFGTAVRERLEAMGARVAGLDRVPGPDILEVDLRDPGQVRAVVEQAVARLGGLDIVINNAGVGMATDSGAMPGAAELEMLEVNLLGAWRVTAAALPELLRSRGRVINVASGLAVVNLPMLSGYMASKRALAAWTDAFRLEYGPRLGAVTTIFPGYVRTAIHDRAAAEGYSMEGLIPAEPIESTVAAIVGACSGPARREVATTRRMRAGMVASRLMPSLADRAIAAAAYRAVRRGRFAAGPLGGGLRVSAAADRGSGSE